MSKRRNTRRTAAKKEKKKISFEKKVLLQSLACIGVFAYCMVISATNSAVMQKELINKAVNETYTKSDIKRDAAYSAKMFKSAVAAAAKSLDTLVYFCNNGFGNEDEAVLANKNAEAAEVAPNDDETLPSEQMPQQNDAAQAAETPQSAPVFRMPLDGKITSGFGERIHPISNSDSRHYGIDIAGNNGDCVISALPGVVEATGFDAALGNFVKVRHSDTLETVYGHLSAVAVQNGETVDGNTRIGSVGSTGAATGPHLHFEVRENGKSVNPKDWIGKSL